MRAFIVAVILLLASSAWAGPEILMMALRHNYQTSTFESSLSPWTATTSGGGIADQSNTYSHVSSYSARLAGYSSNGAYGYIYQTPIVPRSGYLDFWYLTPSDYTGLGTFTVALNGTVAATIPYPGSTGVWYHSTSDVHVDSSVNGIEFRMTRTGATNVWMYVDDIKVPIP